MEEMTGKGKNDASCAAHISYIHPLSIVDEGSDIGSGTRVWAGAHVMTGAKIGQDCNIGEHCFVEGGVTIGDRVTVKNNVALYCGAVIEDDVFLGPSCVFTNVINPRAFVSRKSEFRKTIVRRGASIGANATLICGHTVGEYAFVGAGAVVSRDVPDFGLVCGVPANLCGWVCKCGSKLEFSHGSTACIECGEVYEQVSGERIKPVFQMKQI